VTFTFTVTYNNERGEFQDSPERNLKPGPALHSKDAAAAQYGDQPLKACRLGKQPVFFVCN
jgi:hypothetical protein